MTDQHSKHSGKIFPENGERAVMVAGCDLGKSSAKFVLLNVCKDGSLVVKDYRCIVHNGRPLDAFRDWYNEKNIASCAALAATGLHSDELVAPVISELPEDACIAAALRLQPDLQGPVNLVSLGARGYSIFTREPAGPCQLC